MKFVVWSGLGFFFTSVVVACSSGAGGGGAAPCDDAGLCQAPLVCQAGYCVMPEASAGGGPSGGMGGMPSGGMGGMSSGGTGGMPSGGMGGMPSGGGGGPSGGGSGGIPPGGGGGPSGGTGGDSANCTSSTQGATCNDVWDTTTACGTCIVSKCCSQTNACFATKECSGFFECIIDNCATATDIQTCASQYCSDCATTQSINLFNAVNTCVDQMCGTECA